MQKRIGGAILMVAGLLMGAQMMGCGSGDDEHLCQTSSAGCGGSFQTCCSSSDCYYTYAGRTYQCNGTNCDAAATQLVNAMCGSVPGEPLASTSASQEAMKRTASELAAKANGQHCSVCP